MKNVTFLILVLLIVGCKENPPELLPAKDLKFKSIKVERYAVDKTNPDSTSLSSYIIKNFDENGLEINSIYYAADNSIMMQFYNEYENGNKTKIDWVNGKDETVKYVKMTYDTNDRIIKSESFNTENEFQSGFIHRWKENGKIEEKGPIKPDETFKPNSIYTYNDQHEFVKLVEYDENDSLYGTFKWKYSVFNDFNEWTERQMYFNDTLVRLEKRKISYRSKD